MHPCRVRHRRLHLGLSLQVLATQVLITIPTLAKIEQGGDVKLSVMRRIAKHLNSSAIWLWPEENN